MKTTRNGFPVTAVYLIMILAVFGFAGCNLLQQLGVTQPTAPTGLAAAWVSGSTTQIAISWNSSTGATSYSLNRSSNGSSGPWTNIYSGAATSFTDTNLTGTNNYWYEVAAVNGAGTSADSNVVEVYSQTGTPPAAPTGLAAAWVSGSTTSIAVSWSSSSGATSYTLSRSLTGASGSWTNIYTGASLGFTDTGLTGTNNYWYEVAAMNGAGTGAYSTAVEVYGSSSSITLAEAIVAAQPVIDVFVQLSTDTEHWSNGTTYTSADGSLTASQTSGSSGSGTVTLTSYYDSASGYKVSGTGQYSFVSDTSVTISTSSALSLSGGPVSTESWSNVVFTYSTSAYTATSGTITCNGVSFSAASMGLKVPNPGDVLFIVQ